MFHLLYVVNFVLYWTYFYLLSECQCTADSLFLNWIFHCFFYFIFEFLFSKLSTQFLLDHYFDLLDTAKQLNPDINIVCYETDATKKDATKKLIHTTAIKSLLFLVLFLIYCYGWIPRNLSFFFNTVETTLIFFVDTLFCVYYLTLQRLTFQIFLFPECIHIRNFKVLHSCKNLS